MKRQHSWVEVLPLRGPRSPLPKWPGQPPLTWATSVPTSHGKDLATELHGHQPLSQESNQA